MFGYCNIFIVSRLHIRTMFIDKMNTISSPCQIPRFNGMITINLTVSSSNLYYRTVGFSKNKELE
jgi:hypothetical protein